ncbi:MAG: heparinase II/III family protein [Phycisphaerae bacterium]|nr:heparinase II/III family protein [Phycisphaerae bacterium]
MTGSKQVIGIWMALLTMAAVAVGDGSPVKKQARPAGSGNMITNPGFEADSNGDGIPDGWRKLAGKNSPPVLFTRDGKVKRSGKYSVSIRKDKPAGAGWWRQTVSLKPNAKYELVVYVKGRKVEGARGARVQIWFRDKNGKQARREYCSTSSAGTFGWKRTVHRFTTPENTACGVLGLVLVNNTGKVWFDDLYLKELPLVKNKQVIAPPMPILPVEHTTLTTTRPTFRWNNRHNAAGYILEISPDKNFAKNVLKIEGIKPSTEHVRDAKNGFAVTATEYVLPAGKALGYGKWYWRVSYLTKTGQKSLLSAVKPFGVSRTDKDRITCRKNLKHPYLYFTREDVPLIKEKIKRSPACKGAWLNILAMANSLVDRSTAFKDDEGLDCGGRRGQHGHYLGLARDMKRELQCLGFAYVMTGDDKYARKARARLLALAKLKKWVGAGFLQPKRFGPLWTSALETGEIAAAVAVGYDCIYDFLSPEERAIIRKALVEKGIKPLRDWFDPDYYSKIPRHMGRSGNWDMVCSGGAGVAALAIINEEADAPKWARQVRDNVRRWLTNDGGDYGIGSMSRRAVKPGGPSGPNFHMDGGFCETPTYMDYAMRYTSYFCSALKNTTDQDLFKYFPSNITDILVCMMYQGGKQGMGTWTPDFGDTEGRLSFGEIYSILTREQKDTQASWLLKSFPWWLSGVHSLLWYDDSVSASPPSNDVCAKHFRGVGWVIMRSGYGPRQNMLAIKSRQNRGHHDLGTFSLSANGEKLIVDSGSTGYGSRVYRTYSRWTQGHNVVMVDDVKQKRTNGKVSAFVKSAAYAYTAIDLAAAYPGLIDKWRRHVLYLSPDYYVMIDELRSDQPHKYEWLCHPQGTFKSDGEDIVLTTNNANLLIKMAEPREKKLTVADGYIKHNPAKYLRIRPKKLLKNANFVTILYPYDADKTKPDTKAIRQESTKGFTVKRSDGTDVILYSPTARIRYKNIVSDGKIAVISRDGKGTIQRLAMHYGKNLEEAGKALFSGKASMNVCINYCDTLAEGMVKLGKPGQISLYCPFQAETVFVAGKKKTFEFDKSKNLVTLAVPEGEHEIVMTKDRVETIPSLKRLRPALKKDVLSGQSELKKIVGADMLNVSPLYEVAQVTASSTNAHNLSYRAMDGDLGTWWVSAAYIPAPHWLVVEFKKPREISQVHVRHHKGLPARTSTYRVQTWDETTGKWVTQDSIKDNTKQIVISRFPSVKTGKIRLYITKSNRYSGNARILELKWQ